MESLNKNKISEMEKEVENLKSKLEELKSKKKSRISKLAWLKKIFMCCKAKKENKIEKLEIELSILTNNLIELKDFQEKRNDVEKGNNDEGTLSELLKVNKNLISNDENGEKNEAVDLEIKNKSKNFCCFWLYFGNKSDVSLFLIA
jgi:hypothetical protein